ncbi:uncharacterized protein LOC127248825 isoform X2 [Andrographis paniculata]|uniref:uncharacterized protein LOC127248825 isoform X2 n=1 Tax=Andrographis paniculata TaxID=175694 RepID=UPI0021E8CDDD|nr:uncharacterized protein LOC127248825 isoform X2 [Andrographis paniculata]
MMSVKAKSVRTNIKRSCCNKAYRFLISITVSGSAGPIRFVVHGDDTSRRVIEMALKIYSREERLPVLDSNNFDSFFLYPATAAFDALEPWETIGSCSECRNFVLYQKPEMRMSGGRGKSNPWRSWLKKSFSPKIIPRLLNSFQKV